MRVSGGAKGDGVRGKDKIRMWNEDGTEIERRARVQGGIYSI